MTYSWKVAWLLEKWVDAHQEFINCFSILQNLWSCWSNYCYPFWNSVIGSLLCIWMSLETLSIRLFCSASPVIPFSSWIYGSPCHFFLQLVRCYSSRSRNSVTRNVHHLFGFLKLGRRPWKQHTSATWYKSYLYGKWTINLWRGW